MTDITNLYSVGSQVFMPVFAQAIGETNYYFTVLEVIKGGMGGCLKISSNSGNLFGLKIILPNCFTNKAIYDRYLNELKNWITFSMCDGILDAYRIFDLNGIPCVISPWMDKGDLYSLMKIKERTVFYNSIHRIVGTLKWVVDNYNTIHRDLKPANVLVDSNFLPYVGDWGLAKRIGEKENTNVYNTQENNGLTQKGSFLGTFHYASPEQLLDSTSIDHRSDIFALGVIMYEWVTGNRPFVGKTLNELTNNIKTGRFRKFDRTFNPMNFGIEPIINKCLELRPDDRFNSYQELMDAIENNASDVISFTKYIPSIKGYRDLIDPKTIKERLEAGDVMGVISKKSKGAYVLTEEEHIWEQMNVAINIGEAGNYNKALELLKKILPPKELITKFPDLTIHQNIIINLSYFFNKTYRPEEAENLLVLLVGAQRLPPSYYINLSNSYLLQKKFTKSLEVCKRGIQIYGDDPDLLGNACLAATHLEDFNEATFFGNKRLKINPCLRSFLEYAILLLKYGDSLKESNFPEAIKMYRSSLLYLRKAKEFNPNDFDVNIKEAEIYFKLKRYEDSSNIIGKLEYNECTVFWMVKNLLWTGASKSGISFCDKHIPNFPDSILLKRMRCECVVDYCLFVEKDQSFVPDNATFDFLKNILNDFDNRIPSDLRLYGLMLFWQGNIKGAFNLFSQAKNIYPEEWTYSLHLSYLYLSMGNYYDALREALNAKKLAPWREKVYELLSKCYSYLEEYEKAEENLNKSNDITSEKEKLYNSCRTI